MDKQARLFENILEEANMEMKKEDRGEKNNN